MSDGVGYGWWDMVVSLPMSMLNIFMSTNDTPTTEALMKNACTPLDLLRATIDRQDELLNDPVCLAHARLTASNFLLSQIFRTAQRLESRAVALRLDGDNTAKQIRVVLDVLYQFCGIHVAALDDIRAALRQQSLHRLAHAVVTSCKQASSFMHAVLECKRPRDLHAMIKETVYTSISDGGTQLAIMNSHYINGPTVVNHHHHQHHHQSPKNNSTHPNFNNPTNATTNATAAAAAAAAAATAATAASAGTNTTNANSNATAAPGRPRSRQEDDAQQVQQAAGQLGKFLGYTPGNASASIPQTQSSSALPTSSTTATTSAATSTRLQSSTSTSLSTRNVSLMLQILQNELHQVSSVHKRLSRTLDRDFGVEWDLQRRPARYVGLAVLCVQSARTMFIHSRFLGGTGQLEDTANHSIGIVRTFVRTNISLPIRTFYDNLFSPPTLEAVDVNSVALARSTLRGMLIDFTTRYLADVPGAIEAAEEGSMTAVMEAVKEQAAYPIRNSIAGSLAQAILLQVQKLKCDVDELMLKTKQLLRAQELNLALVALVPSVLTTAAFVYFLTTGVYLWRTRDRHLIVSGAQTARLLLGDIHSALVNVQRDGVQYQNEITGLDNNPMDGGTGNNAKEREFTLRRVRALGFLHAKVSHLEDVISNDVIRMAPSVKLRVEDDIKILRNGLVNLDDRKGHVVRMLLCYSFLRD